VLVYLKSSPYIQPIIHRANFVEFRLLLLQDTLDQWIRFQRIWLYLMPIFSSDDIKVKLPLDHRKFEALDRMYHSIMQMVKRDPTLWDCIESEKMKNEFDQANRALDTISKSLSEYLETKRRFFPRLYFLSDEQLLEVLAETKDPKTIQRHASKCFEAINSFEFENDDFVVGMYSPEDEYVPLR